MIRDKKLALKWAEALESGKYTQGSGHLHQIPIQDQRARYCCLGVLCEVAKVPDSWDWKEKSTLSDAFRTTETGASSSCLREFFHMSSQWEDKFVNMNDVLGLTFKEIAARIRAEIKEQNLLSKEME